MGNKRDLSLEDLKELLEFNTETGILFWKNRDSKWFISGKFSAESIAMSWNSRNAGKQAINNNNGNGYKTGYIFETKYYAHRLIWTLHNEKAPEGDIDHINGIRDDNRIENLRVVNRSENQKNIKIKSNNKTGVMGVCWVTEKKKYRAEIKVEDKTISLGYFHNLEEAAKVRKEAEIKYGYHKNHGRLILKGHNYGR